MGRGDERSSKAAVEAISLTCTVMIACCYVERECSRGDIGGMSIIPSLWG